MRDDRCHCDVCGEDMRYAFSPHVTKDDRICHGKPRIVNPDPDEADEWPKEDPSE